MVYQANAAQQFLQEMNRLRNTAAWLRLDLHLLSGQLTAPRAKVFANEGIGRRLPVIERCVRKIFEIYPPDRANLLGEDELIDVAINLHAFAINVYGIFDNVAWVCVLEAGASLPAMDISLFKKQVVQYLPARLKSYVALESTRTWFNSYAKPYRDSTAHRIAPYIPTKAFTPTEAAEWRVLHAESHDLLMCIPASVPGKSKQILDEHERLRAKMLHMGDNSPYFAISLTGADALPLVQLHPQLLTDWMSVHELLKCFIAGTREERGLPVPDIPEVQVC